MEIRYKLSMIDKFKITSFLLKKDSYLNKSYSMSRIVKEILLIYMIPIFYKTFLLTFVGAEKNKSLEYHVIGFFKKLYESFFIDLYSLIIITIIYLFVFFIWRSLLISVSQKTAINNYVNTLAINESGIKLQNDSFIESINIDYIKEIVISNEYLYFFGDRDLLLSVVPTKKIETSRNELDNLLGKNYKKVVKEVH
ncbi:hypothetical protein JHL18_07840 [Clostridium sp. YIM B02505]|uniref:YcxB-like protein domain-containing protein n=1 Tax=Clostridium yunnanense TaxID=2800325 RepID=A0ABS1EMG1_9CLOT|nr:hypothetical protein [Clostridium yunnanense]MBK1810545.1 hypothetical protein [Clostridium yunnanense]